ncbi:MAG: S-adenosylmethionine:tRNA ribosyltransferase-isomerase [Gaiellales bacterium]
MSAVVQNRRLEADAPPEQRGAGRDDVAMLVARRSAPALVHARFGDLPQHLEPGDLLVVNTSATLPAALDATLAGRPVELRLSTPAGGWDWVVELRRPDLSPYGRPPIGATLALPAGASAELLSPWAGSPRLSIARLSLPESFQSYLARHGHPVRYDYVPRAWPIEAYQTVFAAEPGSAEMPSAGRPFTHEMVTRLVTAGIVVAPITLHTGLSSPERGEPPVPERYSVPAATARLVGLTRAAGGRVIAVGTTVVRALETVAGADGAVSAGHGWTRLVITPERGLHVVDGLLTGWHEPESSHLAMLEAAAGHELIQRSYREAARRGYLWHEFGDMHLLLP